MKSEFGISGMRTCLLLTTLILGGCNKEGFYEKTDLTSPQLEEPAPQVDGPTSASTSDSTTGSDGTDGTNVSTDSTSSTSSDSSSSSSSDSSSTTGADGSMTTGSSSSTDSTSSDATSTSTSTTGSDGSTSSTTGDNGGNGNPTTHTVIDNFNQNTGSKKIDILWIIDNSGSMGDEQDALAFNFSAFINDFITKSVDFKMSITTTDPNTNGTMVNGSADKLNSTAAALNQDQFMTDFKNMVKVGTRGSGNEQGLNATEGFINKYQDSFFRTDAYLAVVFVSDENDQSPQLPSYYTQKLKALKSNEGLVKAYSIVNTNLNQAPQNGITLGYDRYADVSEATAGFVTDITTDFYHSLSDISANLIELIDSFALSQTPVAGSLKVFVNDTESVNYTYNPDTRSIKFNDGFAPAAGALIRVEYEVLN